MKTKLAAFAVALLSVCMLVQPSAMAIGISIELGDQPYYDGPTYWDSGYEWVWVPGYRGRHHHDWVHGRYERRGQFHREHSHERHHHGHHGGDHHHDH